MNACTITMDELAEKVPVASAYRSSVVSMVLNDKKARIGIW